LVGFLAHGLVDFGWRLPANLVYAATLLAIIDATATKKKGNDEPVTFFSSEKGGEAP
jgi:hypothetical protein